MRMTARILVTALVFFGVVTSGAYGQQKLAQTGLKFLAVTADPRAEALAGAFTAVEGSSSAMFFNPSCMARLNGLTSIMLARTNWIGEIKHNFASIAFSPFSGDYGVLGVAVQFVDYGEIIETIRDGNPAGNGYIDLGTFKPTGLMVGVGYARALSDKFSVGGNVKFAQQDLGETVNHVVNGEYIKAANKTNVVAFDFGILYRTGFKSLNFGMTVRNFSREVRYQDEGFQLPLTFTIGISMDVLDLTGMDKEMHSFLLAVDAEHPRDYAEQLRIGGEYLFMKTLALRIGYVGPADEHSVSYGIGVKQVLEGVGFGFDYSYTPFGIFDPVHRFALQFSL
jgi:hypothetical protein